ncbi:type II secretion system F family protein [Thauera propionica]|jgi:tight adherence protein B|uniref:type II secretion system F family protein n=1 Tax=Thauera propionica TaxID=2019431 RepID=UPI0023F541EC|nr:type II secretion system F family protein [Thauera propionica]MDD3676609.1 type II secretion system F family protein [Thauera propionica]
MRFEVWLLLLILLLVAAALGLMAYAKQRQLRHRLLLRLPAPVMDDAWKVPEEDEGLIARWLEPLLEQAGYEPNEKHGWIAAGLAVLCALMGFAAFGLPGVLLSSLLFVGSCFAWLLFKANRRRQRLLEQLPLFLDAMIRAIRAGNSLEQSVETAVRDSSEPLRSVFEGVMRQVRLGMHLDQALAEVARLYRLQELELLQTAVSVNLRYGGSIREILESVIRALRQAEAARREFQAMTGETRLSAWIMALLPVTLALYIMAMNPDYFMQMWNSEGGRRALYFGAGMQVAGAFVIWRMLKSV